MKKFDPQHAAKHGYTEADWDTVSSPELEAADLAKARSFADALPDLAASARKSLGRPKSESPKVAVSLRLDAEIVEAFKAGGPGWQSRINAALRKVAHLS